MPNHYTNLVIATVAFDGDDEEADGDDAILARIAEFAADPIGVAVPMPDGVKGDVPGLRPPWYRWAEEHWGTKWGSYGALPPLMLPGDTAAVLLVFQTAWGPPHAECRAKIQEYAAEQLGIDRLHWVGVNPFDDSVCMHVDATKGATT